MVKQENNISDQKDNSENPAGLAISAGEKTARKSPRKTPMALFREDMHTIADILSLTAFVIFKITKDAFIKPKLDFHTGRNALHTPASKEVAGSVFNHDYNMN
jgi:hypothetical protein